MENLTDSSWIWDETNDDSTLEYFNMCESLTNHWLYFIFSGYLLPLISPRVRDFIKDKLSSLRNGEKTGQLVSLTEFGFEKIQDIEDNNEMKDYIKRLCKNKNPGLLYTEETIEKMAWLFSGEKKDGEEGGMHQTYKKLNKLIDGIGVKVIRP